MIRTATVPGSRAAPHRPMQTTETPVRPMSGSAPDPTIAATPRPDWARLHTVLLDLDGTLLDLHYDNHFWGEYLPAHLARQRAMALPDVHAELEPHFRATRATLDFYCLDHWTRLTGVDIPLLKRDVAHLIGWRQDARAFLGWARAAGKRTLVVTNAHPGSWGLKHEHTGFLDLVDGLVSAHDVGLPKEDPRFWERLADRHAVSLPGSLFVDDNLDVIDTADAVGLGSVWSVLQPDSRRPARDLGGRAALQTFAEIRP